MFAELDAQNNLTKTVSKPPREVMGWDEATLAAPTGNHEVVAGRKWLKITKPSPAPWEVVSWADTTMVDGVPIGGKKDALTLAEFKEQLIAPIQPTTFESLISSYGLAELLKRLTLYAEGAMILHSRALTTEEQSDVDEGQALLDTIRPMLSENLAKIVAIKAASTYQAALDASNG